MSKPYSLKVVQNVPVTIDAVWDFFSNPVNLKNIMPAVPGFKMISKHHGEEMCTRQIIEYKVNPFLQIPYTG
jgi:carbon monoxide dehydrogenase subunit G